MKYCVLHPRSDSLNRPRCSEWAIRALLRQSKIFTLEDALAINKLRYVHSIRGTPRDITIEERKINYIKIKIVPFTINFSGNCTIRN